MSNAQVRYALRRQALVDRARDVPCVRCGHTYPRVCMDLHHRDPSTKVFSLAQWASKGIASIEAELAKCDAVCANCHRIVTHGQEDEV